MAGFFSKLFGGGEKKETLESVVEATINGILENGNFDLSYELNVEKKEEITEVKIEFSGGDEALLKDYKGQLLDAIQLIVKRVTQHHFSDTQTNVIVDCGGYRDSFKVFGALNKSGIRFCTKTTAVNNDISLHI